MRSPRGSGSKGHVKAALGDQNLRCVGLHAGDRAQQLDHVLVRGENELDPFAEVLDGGIERVDVREQLRDHHRLVLDLEAAGERLRQLRDPSERTSTLG